MSDRERQKQIRNLEATSRELQEKQRILGIYDSAVRTELDALRKPRPASSR